ncbi:unnamed protein product [Triticum turgidum subsp. durum]|uniref:VWFA domain-containing protein n=1 Tax=Triticum turgidum subsp. durum TaxID=4567 RepID=A0A9R0WZX6_TRITD|nr:unnamed protein product [Triticum turgidum subsp. durum]
MEEDFERAVEDGLRLSKRLVLPGGAAPPRPHAGMDRYGAPDAAAASSLLPVAPMAYAVVTDPAAVDSPDVPSYQPHVYGRLSPPALIPLQMREVELRVNCATGCATAEVTLVARWWLHCLTRSRDCDCRLVVPMGEEGSILGAEVTVGKKSYSTHVIDVDGNSPVKIVKTESGGILKCQFFQLTIPQVVGGEDIFATIRWSQKLLYDNGQFSVDIPFRFPHYVNPLPKLFTKKEKIQLAVNSGVSKEVLLLGTSHPLKEKTRQAEKLFFLHEAVVENWSIKDFTFSYSVYSGDVSGGVLVQRSTLRDYDDRDIFSIFLLPGNNQNRKIFRKAVVFIVDTSGSMQGKPIENVKNAISTAVSELEEGDYFNIVTFNDELHSFSSCLEKVNGKTTENAINWMNSKFVAEGGTDIMHPLTEALALLSNSHGALPQIFLVTDGSVEDERNICHTVKTQLTNKGSISPRISTFGLGSYCNHYFLRMLASIGKGHYDAAFDTGSIECRMLQWFQKASSTIVADISIDVTKHTQEFEVLAKQQMDLLTAKAWLSENKQLEQMVAKMSIQNGIPSEYTRTVLLQTIMEKIDPAQQGKRKPKKPEEPSATLLQGLTLGFGSVTATTENLTSGFGDTRAPDKFEMFGKAVGGCCARVTDCCCCMCFINCCSKMNDRCAIVLVQACAALSFLGCFECCTELCCGGGGSD